MSSLEAGLIVSMDCRTEREVYELEDVEGSLYQKECLAMHDCYLETDVIIGIKTLGLILFGLTGITSTKDALWRIKLWIY